MIVTYAPPNFGLYVRLDNQAGSLFNMTPGTGKKARRYYVPDTTLAKAKLPVGAYTAEICVGASSTASMDDEVIGTISFAFDGTQEITLATMWSTLQAIAGLLNHTVN